MSGVLDVACARITLNFINGVRSPSKITEDLAGLTGLRGFAAILVVAYHVPWQIGFSEESAPISISWLFSLDVGVGIFFALSAFLLSRQLELCRQGQKEKSEALKSFLMNRFARIYPLYIIVVCISFALDDRTFTGWGLVNFSLNAFAVQNYLYQNFVWQINSVLWAIAVEFQFYVLLAFAFWASWGMPRNLLAKTAPAIILVFVYVFGGILYPWVLEQLSPLLPVPLFGASNWPQLQGWSILHFLPWFIPGVLAGMVSTMPSYGSAGPSSKWDALFWLSVMISVPFILDNAEGEWRSDLSLECGALIAVITVAIFALPNTYSATRFLRSNKIERIGLYSFGIYLFHYPIQKISAPILTNTFGVTVISVFALFALSFAVSYFLAALSFHLWEWPARSFIRTLSRRAR